MARAEDTPALRRAFVVLSHLHNACLFEDPAQPANVIPRSLAVPLCGVSEELGVPPTMIMAGAVLWNWRLIDSSAVASDTLRPSTANSSTLVDIAGGQDELWFFILSLEVVSQPALRDSPRTPTGLTSLHP